MMARREWTHAEVALLLAMDDARAKLAAIARALGRRSSSVSARLRQEGRAARRARKRPRGRAGLSGRLLGHGRAGKGKPASSPTPARPGTPEKVAVMCARRGRSEGLFHELDGRVAA